MNQKERMLAELYAKSQKRTEISTTAIKSLM